VNLQILAFWQMMNRVLADCVFADFANAGEVVVVGAQLSELLKRQVGSTRRSALADGPEKPLQGALTSYWIDDVSQ